MNQITLNKLGDFGNDALSSVSGGTEESNKITAISNTDSDYLYFVETLNPSIIRLRIYMASDEYKTSQPIELTSQLQQYDFAESEPPAGGSWDAEKLAQMQPGITNAGQDLVQTFKRDPHPNAAGTITSAGVRVWAMYDSENDLPIIDKVVKIFEATL